MRRQTSAISWLDSIGLCLRATAVYSSHFGPTVAPMNIRSGEPLEMIEPELEPGRAFRLEVSGFLDRPALAENRARRARMSGCPEAGSVLNLNLPLTWVMHKNL